MAGTQWMERCGQLLPQAPMPCALAPMWPMPVCVAGHCRGKASAASSASTSLEAFPRLGVFDPCSSNRW